MSFLKADPTDKQKYDYASFVCADFAELLHNNAEKEGWRTAYVAIRLSQGGHALNAFETTDRGLVYVDSVSPLARGITNSDKLVDVKVGREYLPESIFPEPGWSSVWESMGVVEEIETVQW